MATETEPGLHTIEIARPEALRLFIIAALFGLAGVAGFTAVMALGEFAGTVGFMGVACLGLLFVGRAMFLTDASRVIFDGDCLRDDTGLEICRLEEIVKVERGFALFKPSSGFVLMLKAEKPRGWSPGLWWRYGRRIGVGGATPSRAGRAMADAITATIAMKNAA